MLRVFFFIFDGSVIFFRFFIQFKKKPKRIETRVSFHFSIESFLLIEIYISDLFFVLKRSRNSFCREVMIYFRVFATSQLEYFKKYFPKIKTLKGKKRDSRNSPFVFFFY
jgi:hypothetical protein